MKLAIFGLCTSHLTRIRAPNFCTTTEIIVIRPCWMLFAVERRVPKPARRVKRASFGNWHHEFPAEATATSRAHESFTQHTDKLPHSPNTARSSLPWSPWQCLDTASNYLPQSKPEWISFSIEKSQTKSHQYLDPICYTVRNTAYPPVEKSSHWRHGMPSDAKQEKEAPRDIEMEG